MSSTEKGDRFEDEVFELLKLEISEGRFIAPPERCRIFQKQGYYSILRKDDIIFDIAIEVYLPDEDQYSILFLIECKNTGRSVEVGEAEEFQTKIDGVAKAKGVIASRSSFQSGARSVAETTGIGLLRVDASQTLKWILARPAHTVASFSLGHPSTEDALRSVTDEDFRSDVFSVACYAAGVYTNSISLFFYYLIIDATNPDLQNLSEQIAPPAEQSLEVDYLTEKWIETRSKELLSHANYSSGPVSLLDILQYLSRQDELEFIESDEDIKTPRGLSVLGSISFSPKRIVVYGGADKDSPRTRFTIAHEIGHLALEHGRYMAREYVAESDFAPSGKQSLGIQGLERLEWQANTFASYLLMPTEPLLRSFFELVDQFDLRHRGHGWLFVDGQPDNLKNYYKVTGRLIDKFHVSRQALSIRLTHLGILNDSRSEPTQIAGSLRRMQGDLF